MIRKEALFYAGRFAKPHGFRGELTLLTEYDIVEQVDSPYLVCDMDGIPVPFFTENYRTKRHAVLVKIENVNDEAAARRFSGRAVYYPQSALNACLEENSAWKHLVGYTLVSQTSEKIGVITNVDETTINTLLEVDCCEKKIFVPIADKLICAINRKEQTLVMSLPEGLVDL